MLAHQGDPVLVVDGDHAHGDVGEVHDAVDAGLPVRPRHLVVVHRDPGVLVGDPTVVAHPGPDRCVTPARCLRRDAPDPSRLGVLVWSGPTSRRGR